MEDDEKMFAIAQQREANLIEMGLRQARRAIVVDTASITGRECESCGDDIPVARIRAAPWTRRCIDCQCKAERR